MSEDVVYCMTIRIKKNDMIENKRVHQIILDILKHSGISGATVWAGIGGYGKRGNSDVKIEGISINMPLVIEVIDEIKKLEPILSEIKKIIGNNGLVTLHEVKVL